MQFRHATEELPFGEPLNVRSAWKVRARATSQYPNVKYDPRKDFTRIGRTAGSPMVIVTRKDFPTNNLSEFVDYVKKNQDKVNEAHGGAGGQMHTTCTLLHSIMGTKTARCLPRRRSGNQ